MTVTGLTTTVDPSKAAVAATLTVENRSDRPASLHQASSDYPIRIEGALPVVIPPHGSTKVSMTVVLDRCDSVRASEDGLYSLGRGPALSTAINLVGRTGAAPTAGPEPAGVAADEQLGVTGVVFATGPARTLREALEKACAELRPMLVLIPPGSLRYDAKTRDLTVPLRILVPPGRVRALYLRSRADGRATRPVFTGTAAYTPLWKPTGALTPDATGRLEVGLHYRAPKASACPGRGSYLPDVIATLEVPIPGGQRRVVFSASPNLFDDPTVDTLLCAGDPEAQRP